MIQIDRQTEKNDGSCVGLDFAAAGIPFYVFDTCNGLLLVGIFIRNLTSVKSLNYRFITYLTYITLH